MVAGRFHALLEERGVVFDGSCTGALLGIALGVCDFLSQTLSQLAATPCAATNQMPPHMESAIIAVVRTMLLEGIRRHPPASGDTPELLAATASWAIYGAAKEWVRTPNRAPSEEIAATVQRLVAPILKRRIREPSGTCSACPVNPQSTITPTNQTRYTWHSYPRQPATIEVGEQPNNPPPTSCSP